MTFFLCHTWPSQKTESGPGHRCATLFPMDSHWFVTQSTFVIAGYLYVDAERSWTPRLLYHTIVRTVGVNTFQILVCTMFSSRKLQQTCYSDLVKHRWRKKSRAFGELIRDRVFRQGNRDSRPLPQLALFCCPSSVSNDDENQLRASPNYVQPPPKGVMSCLWGLSLGDRGKRGKKLQYPEFITLGV